MVMATTSAKRRGMITYRLCTRLLWVAILKNFQSSDLEHLPRSLSPSRRPNVMCIYTGFTRLSLSLLTVLQARFDVR